MPMEPQLSVIRGATQKPAASKKLVEVLAKVDGLEGELYVGYPILGSSEGKHPIDALLISRNYGIVVFDLVEGALGDFRDRQDDAANRLEARLRSHSGLVERRKLIPSLRALSYGPALGIGDAAQTSEEYPLVITDEQLIAYFSALEETENDDRIYGHTLSALQNISTIRSSRSKRTVTKTDSKGAKLKRLEDTIATLDHTQSRAVIETVRGVQRIRGLAGSGKTIVLALKAAYLHAQYPNWHIAVTFNTRSLKGQFKRLINTFCISQTGEEPDWDHIRVLSAWGASGDVNREGLYYQFCIDNGLPYYDFTSAKNQFGSDKAFDGAVSEALAGLQGNPKSLYDAILIDEAQDFPPSFLRMCYEMLNSDKYLVYAYDELQNLAGHSVLPPEQIFGEKKSGEPRVKLSDESENGARRDIILDVCYRNSRPVLTAAHALGFGIYRKAAEGKTTGLVQMFDVPQLWTDIGYEVTDGTLAPNQNVTLQRTSESSPPFLENHSQANDLIQFIKFDSREEMNAHLVQSIKHNLIEDELRHDDIVVINPDPTSTRKLSGPIRAALQLEGVDSHLTGVDTDPDVFFLHDKESVTFSGIYRAKGNEAGMVYVINAQDCDAATLNLARLRNQLFTAITRSKAWVQVLGFGPGMDRIQEEFLKVVDEEYRLKFRYPTDEERKQLAIVHRDVSDAERKGIESKKGGLAEIVRGLESGQVHLEDFPPDTIEKLKGLLGN